MSTLERFAWLMFIFCGLTFATGNFSACTTPSGLAGTCIPVTSCPSVLELIRTRQNIEYIRQHQCGFLGNKPAVCCQHQTIVTRTNAEEKTELNKRIDPIEDAQLPDKTLCGLQIVRRNRDELHENASQIQEQPWLAALFYKKNGNGDKGEFKCSGTLISKRYVLTAAQCIEIPGYTLSGVRLGEWKFTSKKDCIRKDDPYDEICNAPPMDLQMEKAIVHEYYNNSSGKNDIALIRLPIRVRFTESVRPICLPPKDLPSPQIGTSLTASGWGITETGARSDVKQKTEFSVVGSERCAKTLDEVSITAPCIKPVGIKSYCNGESGSPVVRMYDNLDDDDIIQWYQEGLVYGGLGCDHPTGVYTRISKYISWILNNLE